MAMEFFKNYIFKDSKRISNRKLKSKLVPNQIIKSVCCVLINFSLKNSYRIKIRIEYLTSAIVFIKKKLILSLPTALKDSALPWHRQHALE